MLGPFASRGERGDARALALALSLVLLLAPSAEAQVDLAVHGEAGGSLMLSGHQRRDLGLDNGIDAMVMPGIRVADFFGLEANVGALWFPTTNVPTTPGLARVFLAGGGLRFDPMIRGIVRVAISAHVDYAYTGALSRLALDVGFAIELQLGADVGLGPFARYVQVLASGPSDGDDARTISYGLSLSIGSHRPARIDTDLDATFDDDDLCIDVPAGAHPDPARPGCPLPDTDGDGVEDPRDACRTEPAGATPDLDRLGCPLRDTDGDGVLDRDDACPSEPAGPHPDPTRAGCALPDSDADGTFDPDDACPTTPAGASPDPERAGCPDGDDDADGVLDHADACRSEPPGIHPDPERAGCPAPDRDHDLIPDASDACPDEPGAPSASPRRHGCPGLVLLHLDSISIERPVYFATGRDTILARSRGVLGAVAEALRLTPEIRHVSIEGHTDDVGDDDANLALSERRARSVMAWLVAHGIDASRLEAHGLGETRPIATGTSRAAREENRRVELHVLDAATGGAP